MVNAQALNSTPNDLDKNLSSFPFHPKKIWWAGLGLYSRVGERRDEFIDELIAAGKEYQEKSLQEKMILQEEKAKNKKSIWELVENTLNNQIAHLLHRLGLSSRDDVDNLRLKIDQLNDKLSLIRQKINSKKNSATKATRTKKKTSKAVH